MIVRSLPVMGFAFTGSREAQHFSGMPTWSESSAWAFEQNSKAELVSTVEFLPKNLTVTPNMSVLAHLGVPPFWGG